MDAWSQAQFAGLNGALTPNLLNPPQVDEMGKAVDVAERNTARFGLTQAEVASRRRWIMQTQREVRCARRQCNRAMHLYNDLLRRSHGIIGGLLTSR